MQQHQLELYSDGKHGLIIIIIIIAYLNVMRSPKKLKHHTG